MAFGIFLLPTFRQPSISCNILQLFDYLCHCSHGHLLSIRLGIGCLSCSFTFWLSQTSCFLSAHVHSCYSCILITHADCHMFNYCFSFHTSPLCKFLPSVLSAYQHSACCILFPVCNSLLLSTNVYYTLSLYFFTLVFSLFFAHSLPLACSFSHALLLSHAHSLPTYHSMCPCDPFHTGHFILINCFSLLLGGCMRTSYSGHTSFRPWSTPLYVSSPFVTQSLCGLS